MRAILGGYPPNPDPKAMIPPLAYRPKPTGGAR